MTSLLFSVDVEEVEELRGRSSRVPVLVERYLDFLEEYGAKGTFFILGQIARDHPGLVQRIASRGHEIGCHSDAHEPLRLQGQAAFRQDLRRNRDSLLDAGAKALKGYRAPYFSMTAETAWAYSIIEEEGFEYSSSVLPARSPLYGWPGFGTAPRKIGGIVELPISLLPTRLLPVPAAGGTYFRCLPAPVIRWGLERLATADKPITSYFHPYDLDEEQPRGAFQGRHRSGPAQWLLRFNRRAVLPRLRRAIRSGLRLAPYGNHASDIRAALADNDFRAAAL